MKISNKIILCLILALTQGKYLDIKRRSIKQQTDNCTSPIPNSQNQIGFSNCEYLYSVTLGIGTPPQYFDFQFDTGSPTLWLPTIEGLSKGFNENASSTYNISTQPGGIEYVDGSGASGFYGTEKVTLTQTDINVTNDILFVNQEKDMSFPGNVIGIVGMGFTDVPNFLDLAYDANQIQTSTFSLELHNESENSILYYDQIPQSILDNTTYCDRYGGYDFWQIRTVGVYADDIDMTDYAAEVSVIDSGTTLFYLNPKLYNQLVQMYLKEKCLQIDGLWVCECTILDSLPKLTFMFSGVEVYIYPEEYVDNFVTNCIVHLGSINSQPEQLLLGDTLFKNYIITFDKINEQVGFNGESLAIFSYGQDWFIVSQYVMMAFSLIFLFVGGFLLYHLRQAKASNIRTANKEIMMGLVQT